jgi:hypothetical protein
MSDAGRQTKHGALFVLIKDGKGNYIPFTLRAASLTETMTGRSPAQKYYTQQIRDVIHGIVETLRTTDDPSAVNESFKELNTKLRRLVPVSGLYIQGLKNDNGGKYFVVKWKDKNGVQKQQPISGRQQESAIRDLIFQIARDNDTTVNYDFNRESDAEYQENMLDLLSTNLNDAFESQQGEPRSVNNWFTFEYTEGNPVQPVENEKTLTDEDFENINNRINELKSRLDNATTIEALNEAFEDFKALFEYLRTQPIDPNKINEFEQIATDKYNTNKEKLERFEPRPTPTPSPTPTPNRRMTKGDQMEAEYIAIMSEPLLNTDIINSVLNELRDLLQRYKRVNSKKAKEVKADIQEDISRLEGYLDEEKRNQLEDDVARYNEFRNIGLDILDRYSKAETLFDAEAILDEFEEHLNVANLEETSEQFQKLVNGMTKTLKELREDLNKQKEEQAKQTENIERLEDDELDNSGEKVTLDIKKDVLAIINKFKQEHAEQLSKKDIPLPQFDSSDFVKKEDTLIINEEEAPTPRPNRKGGNTKHIKRKSKPAATTTAKINQQQTENNIMNKFEEKFGSGQNVTKLLFEILAPNSYKEHLANRTQNPEAALESYKKTLEEYRTWIINNLSHEEYKIFERIMKERAKPVIEQLQKDVMKIKANNIKTILEGEFGTEIDSDRMSEYEARKKELENSATETLEDELYCSI